MLGAVLLSAALGIGLIFLIRGFVGAEPRDVLRALKWVAVVVVAVAVLYLVISGRLAYAAGLAAAALPWLIRLYQGWRRAKTFARMAGFGGHGQGSTVDTRFLRMTLDHDSGDLDGEIREGPFAGRRLSDLDEAELRDLLARCRAEDDASAQVLEAYLDRVHPDWREDDTYEGQRAAPADGGPMTREEASAVLGVATDAGEDEIRAAHHRLIAGLHPDKGGSNWLAARVNEARRVLLGS